jgi:integrase
VMPLELMATSTNEAMGSDTAVCYRAGRWGGQAVVPRWHQLHSKHNIWAGCAVSWSRTDVLTVAWVPQSKGWRMRLVEGVGPASGPPNNVQSIDSVEVLVREPCSGRILAQVVLQVRGESSRLDPMLPAATTVQRDVSTPKQDVAGRIDATRLPIFDALDAWLAQLAALRRKPSTLRIYRSDTTRLIQELGITRPLEFSYDSVIGWLREQKEWKGTTYNRWLTMLRSFSRDMAMRGVIPTDPLEHSIRAQDDGDEGSRAATTEEALALIQTAFVREQADARCKGNRALYDACLFLAACRLDEPSRLQRRHVLVNMDPPRILWTKDINKNHKQLELAICPELARLLREHLAGIDAELRAANRPPAGPDDPVFPIVPSPCTFRTDRKRAKIKGEDHRGRPFTPHSARKWFATELTRQGVSQKMVDHLMRHKGSVEQRYFDPSLEDMAGAVARLPTIWPGMSRKPLSGREMDCGKLESGLNRLTNGGQIAEDMPATRSPHRPQNSTAAGGTHRPSAWSHLTNGGLPPVAVESCGAADGGSSPGSGLNPTAVFKLEMPSLRLIVRGDSTLVARACELAHQLLREWSDDGTSQGDRSAAG